MNGVLCGAIGMLGSGFVLLHAGLWKLRHRADFTLALREHGRSMAGHAGWLAWTLPIVEVALGVSALVFALPPSTRPGSLQSLMWLPALAVAVLGGSFAVYAGTQLAHGHYPRCACLNSDDRLGPRTLWRALVITLGGVGGCFTSNPTTSALSSPLWVTTIVTGGLMVAAVLVVGLPLVTRSGASG